MNKEEIINYYDKGQFSSFLSNDNNRNVLKLLDETGISILKNSPLKEERIAYILSWSPYIDELLKNNSFVETLLNSDIDVYYASLSRVGFKSCDKLLKSAKEMGKDIEFITKLFSYLPIEYRTYVIKEKQITDKEFLYNILKRENGIIVQYIINNYDIDLLSHNIGIAGFFEKEKSQYLDERSKKYNGYSDYINISVPQHMITRELGKKIFESYDIFFARKVLNDARYCANTDEMNDYIKKQEDKAINNYEVTNYDKAFNAFMKYITLFELRDQGKLEDSELFYNARTKYNQVIRETKLLDLEFEFNKVYSEQGLEALQTTFKKIKDNQISNYIIDYHFEENFHNVILDIKELLQFYNNGHIKIPAERLAIYSQIANIDSLSQEEKVNLHNYLKRFNIMENFYDDMSVARHIVTEAIKDYSLSRKTIEQYKDDELSKQYGVDVYVIDNNPFFGIVKSGRQAMDKLPTGHSYSLVGNNGIATFDNPAYSTTFLYDSDSINPNQIVHVFPFDSFTLYKPYIHSEKGTDRVNLLMMPDELVEYTKFYNEILILEGGRVDMEVNERIPSLQRIALYCLDEIREQDIEVAKDNDVGIILIDSKKCKIEKEKNSNFDRDIDMFNTNYFNGYYKKSEFEAKR